MCNLLVDGWLCEFVATGLLNMKRPFTNMQFPHLCLNMNLHPIQLPRLYPVGWCRKCCCCCW